MTSVKSCPFDLQIVINYLPPVLHRRLEMALEKRITDETFSTWVGFC